MRKFGICMEGCEEGLEKLLVSAIQSSIAPDFNYVEIGVAYGGTLLAMTEILKENAKLLNWRAVGFDIPNGWALSMDEIESRFKDFKFRVVQPEGDPVLMADRGVTLILHPAAQFLNTCWPITRAIDFGIVDGCHGKACVMADFKALAQHARPGSVIVFHDAGTEDQGTSLQPHCNEKIRVAEAIQDLGLLQEHPEWKQLEPVVGDKARNGATCAVFQRR
jgi:predicted O-methyltransferase YrrM